MSCDFGDFPVRLVGVDRDRRRPGGTQVLSEDELDISAWRVCLPRLAIEHEQPRRRVMEKENWAPQGTQTPDEYPAWSPCISTCKGI